ncbi:MarR family transcriptional regulator [Streptomyces sp. V4-01]|uniref:MarR family transcriptional regulator n=1 Tax=Actinacidiphila polyblastidii TaxID=3110430 RepID=A0ABU7PAD7_9ACTN|nr:MarR family transcriptional regulator [Streptomyces sp. V4-01]
MTDTDGRGAPSAARAQPSSAAVARLRLIVARLYRQLAQASSDDLDLTYAQLSALARVQAHGPVRLGELAALEQVAAPSLTRTLRPLAAAGLISKEADPTDGRSLLVSITAEGGAHLDRIRRARSELLARRMSRLSPEQSDTLLAALPVLELLLTEQETTPAPQAPPP